MKSFSSTWEIRYLAEVAAMTSLRKPLMLSPAVRIIFGTSEAAVMPGMVLISRKKSSSPFRMKSMRTTPEQSRRE